jgi:hypothetical protein
MTALYCAAFALILLAAAGLLAAVLIIRAQRSIGLPRRQNDNTMVWRAEKMRAEAREAIKRSRMAPERKAALNREANQLYDNIVQGAWKLERLRRLKELAIRNAPSPSSARIVQDANEMETRLLDEMNRALDVLLTVPASLMKVEVAVDDRVTERLVDSLDEANARMRDLADAYDDVRDGSFRQTRSS